MTDRRDPRARRLLDPQWHWLASARDRLYAEVEPGAQIIGAAITVVDSDGTLLSYAVDPGGSDLDRVVIPNAKELVDAALDGTIDATVHDEVVGQ